MPIERVELKFDIKPKPNTRWTIEVMAGAVYALKELGMPINTPYLRANYPRLLSRIGNYPGGLRAVITIAGYNPEEEIKMRKRR